MRVIWKWKLDYDHLDLESSLSIVMPLDAEILSIQTQFDSELMLWARVNDQETVTEKWQFWIFGTGHKISNNVPLSNRYLATCQLFQGKLVLHVFGQR